MITNKGAGSLQRCSEHQGVAGGYAFLLLSQNNQDREETLVLGVEWVDLNFLVIVAGVFHLLSSSSLVVGSPVSWPGSLMWSLARKQTSLSMQ